jgi:hypothetical protein
MGRENRSVANGEQDGTLLSVVFVQSGAASQNQNKIKIKAKNTSPKPERQKQTSQNKPPTASANHYTPILSGRRGLFHPPPGNQFPGRHIKT